MVSDNNAAAAPIQLPAGVERSRLWCKSRVATILVSVLLPLLLIAATVMFRAVGIKKFASLYDEQITRAVATDIWKGDLRNNWKYANVPAPFRIDCYNFSSYMYADALAAGPHAARPLIRERIFSAVLGSLAVVLFYFIALHFFGLKTALAALGVMSVFPLLVQDSHYARPEAFATFLCAVVYLLSIPLLRSARSWRYLAASSFCCGLLIACKVSFIPLAMIPLVCIIAKKGISWRTAGVWALFVAAGAFAGVPDAFFHPLAFWHGFQMLRHQYAHEHPPHSLINSRFCFPLLWRYFWQTTGPVCCLLCVIGVGALLWQRRYLRFVLFAAPVLLYVGLFSIQRTFFERNLSHVAPLMAILCGVGLVWVTDRLPARVRNVAFAGILACALIVPTFVSAKLVFKAMRIRPEDRAKAYENSLQKREGAIILPIAELLDSGQADDLVKLAERSASDIVVPTRDYHDGYTLRMLHFLERHAGAREVGYLPSLFPQFSPNTILAYHSPGLRYIRLTAPDSYQINGMTFVSWRRVSQVLRPLSVKPTSWIKDGTPPDAKIPMARDEFFGSYTPEEKDANRGSISLGPIEVRGQTSIGIPLITGPDVAGLSVTVLDHASHRVIAQLNPPPTLPLCDIWQAPLRPGMSSQIDVIANDNGAGWGQWLGIGLPVGLKDAGDNPVR